MPSTVNARLRWADVRRSLGFGVGASVPGRLEPVAVGRGAEPLGLVVDGGAEDCAGVDGGAEDCAGVDGGAETGGLDVGVAPAKVGAPAGTAAQPARVIRMPIAVIRRSLRRGTRQR